MYSNINHFLDISNPFSSHNRPLVNITDNRNQHRHGFTLVELLVVIVIIAGILAIVLPRFSSIYKQNLKSDGQRVAALVRYLYEASESKKLYYRLNVDILNSTLSVEKSTDSIKYIKEEDPVIQVLKLSDGVNMLSITAPGLGTATKGTVGILLSPGGATVPFVLLLSDGEGEVTVEFNPYNGRVKVREGGLL